MTKGKSLIAIWRQAPNSNMCTQHMTVTNSLEWSPALEVTVTEKPPVPQPVKQFPAFFKSDGSLSHSHHLTTRPYTEPNPPCPLPHPTTLRGSIVILTSHIRLSL